MRTLPFATAKINFAESEHKIGYHPPLAMGSGNENAARGCSRAAILRTAPQLPHHFADAPADQCGKAADHREDSLHRGTAHANRRTRRIVVRRLLGVTRLLKRGGRGGLVGRRLELRRLMRLKGRLLDYGALDGGRSSRREARVWLLRDRRTLNARLRSGVTELRARDAGRSAKVRPLRDRGRRDARRREVGSRDVRRAAKVRS